MSIDLKTIEKMAAELQKDPSMKPFIEAMEKELATCSEKEASEMYERMKSFYKDIEESLK